eukprot:TRINITY_DN5822_c0_g1_i5.p1 TRINITY_DN5822_c0_g1~~TRINITY_DN5822_c0_g1_i5.p1  ORF type:complete len:320 (+),score=46.41 TRINITY_DN5822_c0_g1_i5:50-1009(+)
MKLQVARDTLDAFPRRAMEVYTDGACKGSLGGAGVMVVPPPPLAPMGMSESAGLKCSPLRAEMRAIHLALRCVKRLVDGRPALKGTPVNIVTDGKAALLRLQGGPARQREQLEREIWELLQCLGGVCGTITLQFVPGHCGLHGNEVAHALAQRGLAKTPYMGVSYTEARQAVRDEARARWEVELKGVASYYAATEGRRVRFPLSMSRKEEVVVTRLRTGQSDLLRGYHRTVGGAHYVQCGRCPEARLDRAHLLGGCPATKAVADEVWGPGATVLQKLGQPLKVFDYLRKANLLREPGGTSARVELPAPTSAFVGDGPCA